MSTDVLAQPSCQCTFRCPDLRTSPPYTECAEPWTGSSKVDLEVELPSIGKAIDVEVYYCCRVRPKECRLYVDPAELTARCETAVTCLRVAKQHLLDHAEPGRPLTPELRKELLRGVLSTMVCSNPCGMGLPKVEWTPARNRWVVTEKPYEWVFSMPACWNWEKTTNEYWCLTSCGNSYCVYALKVSARKDGVPVDAPIVPVFEEVRVHAFKLQGGRCGGGGVNESCTIDRCDVEFNPACGQ